MFFKKFRALAQVIGFVVVGLLALCGTLSLAGGSRPVVAAFGLAGARPAPIRATQATTPTVPQTMGYMGYLKDAQAQPLEGVYTMTFRIYASAGDVISQALWHETHYSVSVSGGVFNVVLGASEPFSSTLFADPNRLVGLSVAPYDEIQPRQLLDSVAYALHAGRAGGLSASDGDPVDAVTVDAYGRATFAQAVNFNGTVHIAGSLDVGQDTSVAGDAYVDGNIGVGVAQPDERLVVKMDDIHWQNPHFALEAYDSPNKWDFTVGLTDTLYVGYNEHFPPQFEMQKDGDFVVVSGKLGVGTTTPQHALDVAGNITATGEIRVDGNLTWGKLKINGRSPFVYKHFPSINQDNSPVSTGISTYEYNCGLVSYAIKYGDLYENAGTQHRLLVARMVDDDSGYWKIDVHLPDEDPTFTWAVNVLCASKDISTKDSFYGNP